MSACLINAREKIKGDEVLKVKEKYYKLRSEIRRHHNDTFTPLKDSDTESDHGLKFCKRFVVICNWKLAG